MEQAWLIRPVLYGDRTNYTDEFVKKSYIAIGPNNLPQLHNYTQQSIKQYLLDNRMTQDKITAGAISAAINNFVNRIDKEDLALLVNGKDIYVLEVNGDYTYYRNNYGGQAFLTHRRSIKTIKVVERDNLSPRLRSALKSGRQVADISKYYNEIYKLAYGKEPVETAAAPTDTVSVSYPLRPGFNISFSVPSDITDTEAKRLSDYIKTLFFKESKFL